MTLPLDFDSTDAWQKIVKIGLAVAAIYAIVVVGLFLQRNLLGGAFLLLFGLAFYALLRRANRWGFSLNVPSGEFSLDRFSAVGLAEHIVVDRPVGIPKNTGIVQLVGRPGTPTIEVMIDDIDNARPFAGELSAAASPRRRFTSPPFIPYFSEASGACHPERAEGAKDLLWY